MAPCVFFVCLSIFVASHGLAPTTPGPGHGAASFTGEKLTRRTMEERLQSPVVYTPEEAKRRTYLAFSLFTAEWLVTLFVLTYLSGASTLRRRRRWWGDIIDRRLAVGRLGKAARRLSGWLHKHIEKDCRAIFLLRQEDRWRRRFKRKLLADGRRAAARRSLVSGWGARWRGRWRAYTRPSTARRRKLLLRFEALRVRLRPKTDARVRELYAVAKDASVTVGLTALSLWAVTIIFDVARYFTEYEISTDAYWIWSGMLTFRRLAVISALLTVLNLLYTALKTAQSFNSVRGRILVGVLCGMLVGGYIDASYFEPKNRKYKFPTTIPLADYPAVPAEVKAQLAALTASHGVSDKQLFVIVGEQGDKFNAYTLGKVPGANILFTERLLRKLASGEVRFAAAHELGHANDRYYTFRRNRIIELVSVAMCFLTACAAFALLQWAPPGILREISSDPLRLPVWLLALNLFLLVLPVLNNVLTWRAEAYADEYAARLTIREEQSRHAALEVFRHLSEASPFDPDPPFLIQLTLNDHPSIAERRRKVLDYQVAGVGSESPAR